MYTNQEQIKDRIDTVGEMIDGYAIKCDDPQDTEDVVANLLADFRHYLDSIGLEFEAMAVQSLAIFNEDQREAEALGMEG